MSKNYDNNVFTYGFKIQFSAFKQLIENVHFKMKARSKIVLR